MESARPLLLIARAGLVLLPRPTSAAGARGGGGVVAPRGSVVIASPRALPTTTLVVGPSRVGSMLWWELGSVGAESAREGEPERPYDQRRRLQPERAGGARDSHPADRR